MQGQRPCPCSAERGTLLCFIKRRRGSKGEPSPGVPPFFLALVRMRRYVGRFSLACAAIRPHFFGACPKKRCRAAKEKRFFYPGGSTIRWCLPKETVSSRQRKALFLPRRLHHSRERYCFVDGTFLARLLQGAGACRGVVRVRRFLGRCVAAPTASSTPFLCSCAKKRGGAPKKRASGCRHGSCCVPPASPTDSKPQHHSRLRQADLSARSTHRVQINLTHQFVPLGLMPKWERRAGPPR